MKKLNILTICGIITALACAIVIADLSATFSVGNILNLTSKEKEIALNYYYQIEAVPYWSVTKNSWIVVLYANDERLTHFVLDSRIFSRTATQEELDVEMDKIVGNYLKEKARKYPAINYDIPKLQPRRYLE